MKKVNTLSLPNGWEIKKLSEVAEYFNGLTYSPKDVGDQGTVVLRSSNIQNDELDFSDIVRVCSNVKEKLFVKDGDILMCSRNGSQRLVGKTASILNLTEPMTFGTFMMIIRSEFSSYLLWFFKTDEFKKQISGGENTMINQVTRYMLDEIEIPLPPLTEQQRIVAILDEAFTAIAKAKVNAEQNLKNAKELFESYLQGVFENKGEGWVEKTLGDIGKPSMCKRILKEQTSSEGDIPFYKIGTFGKTPNAFISKEIYNEFRTKYSFPKKGDILISASGTIGRRVRYDGEPAFFQDSNIVWIDNDEKQVLNDYLYVFYEFCDWQPSKGATIARLYNSNLTSIKIVFPKSLGEQKNILKKTNALSAETKKLEAIYQQKINDLEELKKSLLQKAFSGELSVTTTTPQIEKADVSVPKPTVKVIKINPTDLQAGIVAIALQRHQYKNRENTFHHVKAEKIVHLAQSILNLELNRNPCKDAAGPNDFPHSKKVESRAKKAGFYNVLKRDDYFEYSVGSQFQKLIDKTYLALDEKAESLNKLIDLIVPMNTQQAEIFATVYAGWNNLLIDNKIITDEDIVTESRENWHKDKLKIDRDKFFKAINWMREKNVIPTGSGNKVLKKDSAKK